MHSIEKYMFWDEQVNKTHAFDWWRGEAFDSIGNTAENTVLPKDFLKEEILKTY